MSSEKYDAFLIKKHTINGFIIESDELGDVIYDLNKMYYPESSDIRLDIIKRRILWHINRKVPINTFILEKPYTLEEIEIFEHKIEKRLCSKLREYLLNISKEICILDSLHPVVLNLRTKSYAGTIMGHYEHNLDSYMPLLIDIDGHITLYDTLKKECYDYGRFDINNQFLNFI